MQTVQAPDQDPEDTPLEAPHPENAFGTFFRNYKDSTRQDAVRETYTQMHTHQTVDFVRKQREAWLASDKGEFTIMQIVEISRQ